MGAAQSSQTEAGKWPEPKDPWGKMVECDCKSSHFGLGGAAGLLLVRRDTSRYERKPVTHVLLQLRSHSTTAGGRWGIPGGALNEGEDERDCALRKASEEVGLPLECTKGRDRSIITWFEHAYLDHGTWSYTTVIANEVRQVFEPTVPEGDSETLEVKWVPIGDVHTLPLHPAFEEAWSDIRRVLSIYMYDHGWPHEPPPRDDDAIEAV